MRYFFRTIRFYFFLVLLTVLATQFPGEVAIFATLWALYRGAVYYATKPLYDEPFEGAVKIDEQSP